MTEAKQKEALMNLIQNALLEMERNQHSFDKKVELMERQEELQNIYEYLNAGGLGKNAYRHIQLQIFRQHESFFMDLFESGSFPILFDLYEFYWRE